MQKSINVNNVTLWSLVGIQVVLLVCLYAMEKRVSLLESVHKEPKQHQK